MAVKSNKIKSQEALAEEPKLQSPDSAKPKKSLGPKKTSVIHFLQNESVKKVFGLLLLFFSFFIFIACVSHPFTWYDDFSEVSSGFLHSINNDNIAANWCGQLGAWLSYVLLFKGLGLASFSICILLFLWAFKLIFRFSLLPFFATSMYLLWFSLFLSSTLALLPTADKPWLSGNMGYQLSQYLIMLLGFSGTLIFLVFALLVFVVLIFKPNWVWTKKEESPAIPELAPVQESTPADEPILKNVARNVAIAKPVNHVLLDLDEDDENAAVASELESFSGRYSQAVDAIEAPGFGLTLENVSSPDINKAKAYIEEQKNLPLEVEEISYENKLVQEAQDIDQNLAPANQALEIENPLSLEAPESISEIKNNIGSLSTPFDPTLELGHYKFPGLDLLENHTSGKIQVNREELEKYKNQIVETLGHYSIEIEKIKATIGPTVTLYEIIPKAGTRISKIKNLEDDIALSLSALGIRIIAPIPGKGTIGIEVPNEHAEIVSMRSIIASEAFQNTKMELPVGMGKTISNEVFVFDLCKMPHLLVAGATGQGKSVGLNAILVSLLYKKHPSQLKFILVDPKKVELTLYKKIERHYLAKLPGEEEAIITDTKKVINTLNSLCIEMDQRYELLKDAEVRNILEYNTKFTNRRLNPQKGHRFLPYIVLVIDEFADLIMTAGKEVELPIARLAQLARAIGIHLIIATQRPSVNIITGTIKANFPARIAFKVTTKIDSRTILDSGGADQLIGKGDMLLTTGADLIRLQCPFVDLPEVEAITDYIGGQNGYGDAFLLPEYIDEKGEGNTDISSGERDSMFDDAARVVVQDQQGSTSLLQRKLKLGYGRAGRIIDQLEAAGIIGPFQGSKAREVLISNLQSLEEHLSRIRNS